MGHCGRCNYTTLTPIIYTKPPLNSAIKELLNAAIAIQIGRKLIENKDRDEGTFSLQRDL
jgi:hypothetical protein